MIAVRRSRRWLGLVLSLGTAGCAQLVGADFDNAPQRSDGVEDAGAERIAKVDAGSPHDGASEMGADVSLGGKGDARADGDASEEGDATKESGDEADAGHVDAGDEADVIEEPEAGADPDADGGDDGDEPADGDDGADLGADSDASGDAPDADADAAQPLLPRVAGVFPLHPILNAGDSTMRADMTNLGANGVYIYVPWGEAFYTSDNSCDPAVGRCGNPTCTSSDCPPCSADGPCYWRPTANSLCQSFGFDELECWVRGALNWWGTGVPPMAVLVSLWLHLGGDQDWRVGPSHITALQNQPSDINNPRVQAAFHEFYDRISRILGDKYYQPFVREWYVSVGQEVSERLCDNDDAWSAYDAFYDSARTYLVDQARHPPEPFHVGVTTSYFGKLCKGLWDFDANDYSPAAAHIRGLNESSDVLLFNYYPADPQRGFAALNPDRAADDVTRMRAFRDSLSPSDAGASLPPIVLSEVGYPLDPRLFDQPSLDDRYSHFVSTPYSTPEGAQSRFIENLFSSLKQDQAYRGFFWWSMFDIPGVDDGICASWVGPTGVASGLNRLTCTSGLAPALGDTSRSAWTTFQTEATGFEQ